MEIEIVIVIVSFSLSGCPLAPKLALQNAEAGTVLFELSILKYRILGQLFEAELRY